MTTYIESKLNPDGKTYDHSEVITAQNTGTRLESWHPSVGVWVRIDEWEDSSWDDQYKYRAIIEDMPICTTNLLVAINVTAYIAKKFQSGNAIPVERITLTRAEVNEVFPGLLK